MKKLDQQIERIAALRHEPPGEAIVSELRKSVSHRNNYLVSKAAAVIAHHGLRSLVPDLETAYERFFQNPVKTDPQCWAKIALAKAMAELEYYDDPRVYLRGVHHIQMEPVWGGQEDTAGPLRAQCCLALVNCRSLPETEALRTFVSTLVDADPKVRTEAARAIGEYRRPEGALVLRLKALSGDKEPDVVGSCLRAVLAIEETEAIEFVSSFLNRPDEVAAEAALALGLCRLPGVINRIAERYQTEADDSIAAVFLSAIAITQHDEALDFLLGVIQKDRPERAIGAINALSSVRRHDPDLRRRVEEAVRANGDGRVRAEFERRFAR